jgi:hypothetical protein
MSFKIYSIKKRKNSEQKNPIAKKQEVIILGSYKGKVAKAYAIAPTLAMARSVIAWELQQNYPELVFSTITLYSDPNAKCEITGL